MTMLWWALMLCIVALLICVTYMLVLCPVPVLKLAIGAADMAGVLCLAYVVTHKEDIL